MVGVAEAAATQGTELAAGLAAGVNTISYNQTITFTKYVRVVLPLDGFVFWVRADQLSASALLNASRLNSIALNAPPTIITPAATMTVQGSLHYATSNSQDEDAAYSQNRVIFTALSEIEDLNEIGPMVKFIGEFDGLRFAFAERGKYYQQSGLHHYFGDAVYSTMDTQVVDDARSLDLTNVVVSNSLPLWLQLDQFMPMYPSFLVPDNSPPPYCAVHILPETTAAIQAFPRLDGQSNQWQLCKERVRLTTFGLRNFQIMDFLQYVFDYSMNTDAFGVMNMPVTRDEKSTQRELSVLAQKKVIEIDISYYQARMRDIAMQRILSAIVTTSVGD